MDTDTTKKKQASNFISSLTEKPKKQKFQYFKEQNNQTMMEINVNLYGKLSFQFIDCWRLNFSKCIINYLKGPSISKSLIMQNQRRLIGIFKAFVQKVFVPQIKKIQGSLNQWNKFSSMLSVGDININELTFFVQSIPSVPSYTFSQPKINQPSFMRKKQESNELQTNGMNSGFNPSKTFGGQRARMAMFPMKQDLDDFNEHGSKKEFNPKDFSSNNNDEVFKKGGSSSVLPGLDKLYKMSLDNQAKIESMTGGGGNSNPTTYEYKPNGYY